MNLSVTKNMHIKRTVRNCLQGLHCCLKQFSCLILDHKKNERTNTKTLKDSVWAEKRCHLFKISVVNKKGFNRWCLKLAAQIRSHRQDKHCTVLPGKTHLLLHCLILISSNTVKAYSQHINLIVFILFYPLCSSTKPEQWRKCHHTSAQRHLDIVDIISQKARKDKSESGPFGVFFFFNHLMLCSR